MTEDRLVKYRMIVAALAALATPAAAGDLPQLAQFIGLVPPYEVFAIVRSAGLDPVGQPVRRGPIYVLRAIDDDDREVRVVVDARYGEIVSITPTMTASREEPAREMPPRRYRNPYERTPDDYGPPRYRSGPPDRYGPPGYRSGPPIVHELDLPLERPRAGVPDDPQYGREALPPPRRGAEPPRVIYSDRPPVIAATPPDGIERRPLSSPRSIAPAGPQASVDTDAEAALGRNGLLPPPPERFPQRAPPPAAKPTPPKRAAAAPPKQAPLPKPRPATDAAKVESVPPPASEKPQVPEKKPAADQMPH